MLKRILKEVHIWVWIKQFIMAPNEGLTNLVGCFWCQKDLCPWPVLWASHVLTVKPFPDQSCLQDCSGWKMPSLCDVAAWFCRVIFATGLFVIPFVNDISIYKVLCFRVFSLLVFFQLIKCVKSCTGIKSEEFWPLDIAEKYKSDFFLILPSSFFLWNMVWLNKD